MSTKRDRDAFFRGVRSVVTCKALAPYKVHARETLRTYSGMLHVYSSGDIGVRTYEDLSHAWHDVGSHLRKAMDEQPEQPRRVRGIDKVGEYDYEFCGG